MHQIQLNHLLRLFFLSYMGNRFNITNHALKKNYTNFFKKTKNNLTYEMFLNKEIELRNYEKEHKEFTSLIAETIKNNTQQPIFKNLDYQDNNLVFLYADQLIRGHLIKDIKKEVFDETFTINLELFEKLKTLWISNNTYLSERWVFTIKKMEVIAKLEESEIPTFNDVHNKMLGKRVTGSFGGPKYVMDDFFELEKLSPSYNG